MNQKPSDELQELISAVCDGAAAPEQIARLEELLRGDEAAQWFYLCYIDMHARLVQRSGLLPSGPAEQPRSSVLGFLGDIGRQGFGFLVNHGILFSVFAVLTAIALTVLVTLGPLVSGGHVTVEQAEVAWPSGEQGAGSGEKEKDTPRPSPPVPRPAVTVARLLSMTNCRWTSAQTAFIPGMVLTAGRKLELASGSAEIKFNCGAVVRVEGPAIFEIVSAKEMQLAIGKASARADTPQSKGFAIRMRTLEAVDLGTEFIALAAPDGHCEISVSTGRVEVNLPGDTQKQIVSAGEAVLVEPGTPCIVTRIESGDCTAAFKFPTIESPSKEDYADASQRRATIRVVEGKLSPISRSTGNLLNGRGQSWFDAPDESTFFADNEKSGKILLDLGRAVAIRKINTYSWHCDRGQPWAREYYYARAPQRYTLYGFGGEAPSGSPPPVTGNLEQNGWTRICRVDTDEFFTVPPLKNRPTQQGVSIGSATGEVGRYRYLLWDARPTHVPPSQPFPAVEAHTFYGEFDVYAE